MRLTVALLGLSASLLAFEDIPFAGPDPGMAEARVDAAGAELGNHVVRMRWELKEGALRPTELTNRLTGERYSLAGAELFRLGTRPPEPTGREVEVVLELAPAEVRVLAQSLIHI